jgi:hypothetical protein
VQTYNHVFATTEEEIVPPCWRRHPGLAHELAVQMWLYYAVYLHPKANPAAAAEFHGRHLPSFRARVDKLLGRSPIDCRKGEHLENWRKEIDTVLGDYENGAGEPGRDDSDVELLRSLHFGFAHVGEHAA